MTTNDVASPLASWASDVRVEPAGPWDACHSIHTYFNTNPESPDGRHLLCFVSTTADAQCGDVVLLERESGRCHLLGKDVETEDAHRVACQQWVNGGKHIVWHELHEGRWRVVCVELATLESRVLAEDRQLGFGHPDQPFAAVYGPHWDGEAFRDLELIDVRDGSRHTPVTAAAVQTAYPEFVHEKLGSEGLSIFFPILSPDAKRVFFKLACPAGGEMRSNRASKRLGLIVYDLAGERFVFCNEEWAHPGWLPDSRQIIQVPNQIIDGETGAIRQLPGLPYFHMSHPTVSADGQLFTTDARLGPKDDPWSDCAIAVADLQGGAFHYIHRFDFRGGANSWRIPHPHPVFSADGRRIYFNVNRGRWTQLYVAERGDQ